MRLQKAPGRCCALGAKKGPDDHCPPLWGTSSSAGTQVSLSVPQVSRASSDSPGPRSLPPPHSLGWLGKEVGHGGHGEAYGGRSGRRQTLVSKGLNQGFRKSWHLVQQEEEPRKDYMLGWACLSLLVLPPLTLRLRVSHLHDESMPSLWKRWVAEFPGAPM